MIRFSTMLLGCAAMTACNFAATGSRDDQPRQVEPAEATPPVVDNQLPTAATTPVAGDVLTASGWGPLRIGMTRSEVEQALGEDSNPEAVGGPEPERCDVFHPARAPEALRVMVEDNKLSRIELIDKTDIRTADGFTVGDAASAIKAKLGERISAAPHKYAQVPAEYLTLWQSGATPDEEGYVDDPAARGITYEIGDEGTVTLIFAGGPAIQYVEGCL